VKITRRIKVCLALALGCLAGCSNDTAHSLSRDYRNINNECIDALMMVTSESRAKYANVKIFKSFSERISPIDKRAASYEQNTDDKQIVMEMVTTESVAMLLAENSINQRRFKLEQQRIKNLLEFNRKTEVDKLKAEGQANPDVKVREKWPNLSELASGASLNAFKSHLDKGTAIAELNVKIRQNAFKKARGNEEAFKGLDLLFQDRVKRFDNIN
jgi:hypothetical protein